MGQIKKKNRISISKFNGPQWEKKKEIIQGSNAERAFSC